MRMLTSLLIANRGEVAVRIIRTAHNLGIRTIAVYSDADSAALHVKLADEAYHIGASPAAESYLDGDKIISIAKSANADAIHPGYGFLSENAAFAANVEMAGMIFVGPSATAIELMGDKARAKRLMIDAGVPCIPGYEGEDQSDAELLIQARKIPLPLMVKAAAGGGGKGMRLVTAPDDIEASIKLARAEAVSAFGVGDLILEKAIDRPRHVEIQIFADGHGTIVHLGERDCSVQRRHQKVIEEAPCPVMTPALRARMGEAAINAARAVKYCGAGTVEFLLDQDGAFYFLEMNTRLQVEHPVTELVTGLDLVAMQLKVARGDRLELAQEDINFKGHAIEVRLYAEDPAAGFLPSTGDIALWRPPSSDHIRVDAGVESGTAVSPFYDPMVAKIIAYGDDREAARLRLINGLKGTALFGVQNNRDFLIDALSQSAFAAGHATTAFIGETYGEEGYKAPALKLEDYAIAALVQFLCGRDQAHARSLDISSELLDWSGAGVLTSEFVYETGDGPVAFFVKPNGPDHYAIETDNHVTNLHVDQFDDQSATVVNGAQRLQIIYSVHKGELTLSIGARTLTVTDLKGGGASDAEAASGGAVLSPMHGLLVEVFVEKGAEVTKGQKLAILEAMKLQHEISATADGVVEEIAAAAGQQIGANDLILKIAIEAVDG